MEDLNITHYLTIPASELQAVYSRSGGPGGQNVNKVNTKATLIWDLNQTQSLYPTTLPARSGRFKDHRRGVAQDPLPSAPRAVS